MGQAGVGIVLYILIPVPMPQLRGDVSFRVRSRFRSFVVGLGGGLRARGLGPELVVGPVVMGRNHRHVQCPALSEPEPLLPSKSF